MKWFLFASGCIGATLFGVVVGVYSTFPASEVKSYAEYQFHAMNKDYALELGEVRPWWLPGVRASDVTVFTIKKGKRSKDTPKPGMVRTEMVKLDTLGVRLQLLPLLGGNNTYGFDASLLGGAVEGSFSQGATSIDLVFSARDLDLSQMPIEKDDMTVHLAGTLSGTSDLALDGEDVKNSTGALELTLNGLQLAAGSKVMGLELPVVTFSAAKIRLEAKDGKLEVTEGTFDGDVLDMTLSGDISLNKKLLRSRNRLELTVTLPEDLDRLAKLAPQMKRARDAEGAYHFNIGGTLLSPTFRPGRGVAGKLAKTDSDDSSLPRFGGGERAEAGSDAGMEADDAREERKKRREDRIKERRERLKKRREDQAVEPKEAPGYEEPEPEDHQFEDRPMRDDMRRFPEDDIGAGFPQQDMPDRGPPNMEFGGEPEE